MNDQQKIEFGEYVKNVVLINESRKNFSGDKNKALSTVSDMVLNKIQELELDCSLEKGFTTKQELIQERVESGEIAKNAPSDIHDDQDNTKNTPNPLLNDSDKTHVCGCCYQTYPPHILKINFQLCHECQHAGRIKIGVQDKNNKLFFSGETLINENSRASEVKILQIQPSHIVFDGSETGCVLTQDFINAGWIVNEGVTRFDPGLTQCKYEPHKIGSVECRACSENMCTNLDRKWVICKPYNWGKR